MYNQLCLYIGLDRELIFSKLTFHIITVTIHIRFRGSDRESTWKEQNGLESYFNRHNSPDLAPIENRWQPVKQTLRKFPHWDDATTKELIYDGWTHVTPNLIKTKKSQVCLRGSRLLRMVKESRSVHSWDFF